MTMQDETIRNNMTKHFVFRTPYNQHKERNGQLCTVIQTKTHESHPNEIDKDDPPIVLNVVRFSDGHTIEAWPDELE